MGAISSGTWRVEPDGVQSVLNDVATAGEGIAKAIAPLAGAATGGSAAADGLDTVACTVGVPSEGLISAAMNAFLDRIGLSLTEIETRVPTAAHAVSAATNAVIEGDDDIASGIQSTMLWTIEPTTGWTGMQ